MSADTQVETLLSGDLDEVLVGADTGGLEGLGAQLLIFVGHEVDAEREVVDGSALAAKIVDADLWVGDTTVEPGLGVGLRVIRVSYTVCVPFVRKRFWMDSAGAGLRISAGLRRLVTRRPPQTGSSPTEVQHREWRIPRLFFHLQTAGNHETMSLSLSSCGPSSLLFSLPGRDHPPRGAAFAGCRCSPCSCSSGSNERDDGPS